MSTNGKLHLYAVRAPQPGEMRRLHLNWFTDPGNAVTELLNAHAERTCWTWVRGWDEPVTGLGHELWATGGDGPAAVVARIGNGTLTLAEPYGAHLPDDDDPFSPFNHPSRLRVVIAQGGHLPAEGA